MKRRFLYICIILSFVLLGLAACSLPDIAASAMLHPPRKRVSTKPPEGCHEVTYRGNGVEIKGWRGDAIGSRHGTVIYLHGIADNRESGAGVLTRFRKRGFDVVACDSRAHGNSGGDACTYGVLEKQDLRMIINGASPGPVILIGSSLGAAISLQHAPHDPRITAIVAAECFSDLRTVATERAPFFLTTDIISRSLETAEARGGFRIDEANPARSARSVRIPVLLVHGAADKDTRPDHSKRIEASLAGPKRLILVPGATHNHSLGGGEVWTTIEHWVDEVVTRETTGGR